MSGSPFTVYSGVQQTGAGAGGTDRPDLVTTPHFSTSRAVRSDYFGRGDNNATFFNIPINLPDGTGPNHGRFGTLGRSTFRGPGFHNFDVALIKDTPFGHRANSEFGTARIPRRILQRLQHRELRFALQHRPRQRLRPDQQNRRLLKTDSVFGEVDFLTTLELIRKIRMPHPSAYLALRVGFHGAFPS